MTELNEGNFFDNVGGGSGAPSAKLKDAGDFVHGEIVDQFMIEATDFSTKKPKVDTKTGKTIMQLVVVVQTENRGWANVAKVPVVDKDDPRSPQKDPSEDDGRRAVYVEPWTNIHAAVGKARQEAHDGAKGPLANGGTLGVQITELKDTGKGNPLKIHRAKYVPPAASTPDAGFFNETASAPAAPTQQPAPAAVPQTDPWATPGAPASTEEPPF